MFCPYFSEVDEFPSEEPLSPSRALRAAMLKRRFADTIVKAQQRALMDQVLLWSNMVVEGHGVPSFGVTFIS